MRMKNIEHAINVTRNKIKGIEMEEEPLGRWLEMTVDSGAANHVISKRVFPEYETRPSEGSLRGQRFVAAGGQRLENEGEQHLKVRLKDGTQCRIALQNVDVKRPLASVSMIADQGNEITFRQDGGTIKVKKTGKEHHFERKDGVYTMQVWVEIPNQGESSAVGEIREDQWLSGFQGFQRQGN